MVQVLRDEQCCWPRLAGYRGRLAAMERRQSSKLVGRYCARFYLQYLTQTQDQRADRLSDFLLRVLAYV